MTTSVSTQTELSFITSNKSSTDLFELRTELKLLKEKKKETDEKLLACQEMFDKALRGYTASF